MRCVALLAVCLALVVPCSVNAEPGAPSDRVLAEMGLGGIKILSDEEASAVRGAGFVPKHPPSEKMIWFKIGIANFREHVGDFKDRLDNRVSTKEIWFRKERLEFKTHVSEFKQRIH